MSTPGDMPPKPPPPMAPPPGMPPPMQPPYGPPGQYGYGAPPPPPKSGAMKWVLIGCGVFAVLGVLCCGGFVGIGWYAWKQIEPMVEEGKKLIRSSEVIQEHIGQVQEDGIQITQADFKNNDGTVRANLRGDKGSGTLVMNWHKRDGKWRLRDAVLTTADGKAHAIQAAEDDVK
jgi:Cytochrome oxidase complex assembly protein 1